MSNPNQGTREWWRARRGHITSSRMHRIVNGGYKAWGTLMDELQAEIEMDEPPELWGGGRAPEAIEWGWQWEDAAIDNAALTHGWDVVRPPFVEHLKLKFIGASSDAILLKGFRQWANVEAKCPINEKRHTRALMNREVPPEHHPQIICQLAVHNLPLSYFISYHPEMPDPKSRLCVLRFVRLHKLEDEMLNKCADFWEIFKRGERPGKRQVTESTGFPSMEF